MRGYDSLFDECHWLNTDTAGHGRTKSAVHFFEESFTPLVRQCPAVSGFVRVKAVDPCTNEQCGPIDGKSRSLVPTSLALPGAGAVLIGMTIQNTRHHLFT
jgi:hypothetical protein